MHSALLKDEFPIRPRPLPSGNEKAPITNLAKGDDLVHWVYKQLLSIESIVEVVDVSGISNSIIDIIVRLKDDSNIRGIQVKSLCKVNERDLWNVYICEQTYPDDTLMAFIDINKTRFVLGYWKDFIINNKRIVVNFLDKTTIHRLFTDIISFKIHFAELVKNSTIVSNFADTIYSSNQLKEYNSIRIIRDEAIKRNIRFEYHWTYDSPIDIYLNGHSCQCKSSSFFDYLLCTFPTAKIKDGKVIPYNCTDVEFFIMNIITDRYRKDVCIIPISVFAEKNRITTDVSRGFTNIGLAPPNHFEYHWCESMWNNFELINNPTIVDPIYNFLLKYKCSIKNTSTKPSHKYSTIIRDYDLKTEYFLFFINNRKIRLYKDYILCISKDDLSKEGKVPVGKHDMKKIYIAPPNYIGNDWSLKYWKKISDWKF